MSISMGVLGDLGERTLEIVRLMRQIDQYIPARAHRRRSHEAHMQRISKAISKTTSQNLSPLTGILRQKAEDAHKSMDFLATILGEEGKLPMGRVVPVCPLSSMVSPLAQLCTKRMVKAFHDERKQRDDEGKSYKIGLEGEERTKSKQRIL